MTTSSMGEGHTPLVKSVQVGPSMGLSRLFFKLESCNPSGSYKDRFVAAEIQRCLTAGVHACVATSSGNTGSSLAAYCARYGLRCFIIVNDDAPAGKLEQMQAHHALVFRVKGFISSAEITDEVLHTLRGLARDRGIPLIISAFRFSPEGMQGVESISRELAAQLPEIDHVFVPVGGGGLLSAICQGFRKYSRMQPRIHGVQPSACSTVAAAFERGDDQILPVESHTRISGLAVPFDFDASLALWLLRESHGAAFGVADEEVFDAQRAMLSREGIYCEPAGAAALAGLRRAVAQGLVHREQTVVCMVTGHGFKDPESVRRAAASYSPLMIEARDLKTALLEKVECA
jgi:threonine synthase